MNVYIFIYINIYTYICVPYMSIWQSNNLPWKMAMIGKPSTNGLIFHGYVELHIYMNIICDSA